MSTLVLSYDDFRVRRSVSELRAFVDKVDLGDIATAEARASARLSTGPRKRYREEVHPTLLFLERLGDHRDIHVSFPCDDGPYDALLTNRYGTEILESLQLVAAIDGYDLRLRMELLSEIGSAPGFGPIRRDKTTRKVEADYVGRSPIISANRPAELVREAIIKKQQKNYPSGSWLIVGVDNALVRDVNLLTTILHDARAVLAPSAFARVYLVGLSDKHDWLVRVDI